MDRYYGFDLGDAESAVTYLKKDETGKYVFDYLEWEEL